MKEELAIEQIASQTPETSTPDALEATRLFEDETSEIQKRLKDTKLKDTDEGDIVLQDAAVGSERERLEQRSATLKEQQQLITEGKLKPIDVLLERRPLETVGRKVPLESRLGRILNVQKEVDALPPEQKHYVEEYCNAVFQMHVWQEQMREAETELSLLSGGARSFYESELLHLKAAFGEKNREMGTRSKQFWETMGTQHTPEEIATLKGSLGEMSERLEQKQYLARIESGNFDVTKQPLEGKRKDDGMAFKTFWGNVADVAAEFEDAKQRVKRGESTPKPAISVEPSPKDASVQKESVEQSTVQPESVEPVAEKARQPEVKERSPEETTLELSIRGAKDFRELWKTISEVGGLQGSQKFYTVDELSSQVARIQTKGLKPDVLTGRFGFRQKVLDLIKLDEIRGKLKG